MADDPELAAIQAVLKTLEPLDPLERQRVFEYIGERLGIQGDGVQRSSLRRNDESRGQHGAPTYATFAELYDAANPESAKDRVLVTAYWLQECEGEESFVSFDANKALKDLGHGLSNITGAVSALKEQKPALVLQLRKSGQTRQARKTYKLTKAGVEAVKEMLGG